MVNLTDYKMVLISSEVLVDELISKYYIKGCHTNNYLMGSAYRKMIDDRCLYYIEDGSNLFFLIQCDGFFKLLYYLNNLNQPFQFEQSVSFVIELVYRGKANFPSEVTNYWLKNDFVTYLTRENYALMSKDVLTHPASSRVVVNRGDSDEEVLFTHQLFNQSLDKYTGDQLTLAELRNFAISGNLLFARLLETNQLCGVLQFEVRNGIVWLGHVAVDEEFRGIGIARELVRAYLALNKVDDSTRYQLWVLEDNAPAIQLYRKFGFKETNRFTLSLIKK
jgi:ribosomal protein S18 acetylase RimI-like enzyme